MIRGPKKTMILQKCTTSISDAGECVKTWTDKTTVTGVFVSRKVKEEHLYSKPTTIGSHRFYVKESDDYTIDEIDRFKLGTNRYFEITGITDGAMTQKSGVLIIDLLEVE
jgi:head-tail adaptor